MTSVKKNPGMNRLANVLSARMKKETHSAMDIPFDFGTIGKDMSLLTDTFPEIIPRGEYMVCRQLTLGKKGALLVKSESAIHSDERPYDDHIHEVLVPEKMAGLLPGDRVLVAWVAAEAVVIDVIEEA